MKRLMLIIAALASFALSSFAQSHLTDGQLYVVDEQFYMNGLPLNDGELKALLGEECITMIIFQLERN